MITEDCEGMNLKFYDAMQTSQCSQVWKKSVCESAANNVAREKYRSSTTEH